MWWGMRNKKNVETCSVKGYLIETTRYSVIKIHFIPLAQWFSCGFQTRNCQRGGRKGVTWQRLSWLTWPLAEQLWFPSGQRPVGTPAQSHEPGSPTASTPTEAPVQNMLHNVGTLAIVKINSSGLMAIIKCSLPQHLGLF